MLATSKLYSCLNEKFNDYSDNDLKVNNIDTGSFFSSVDIVVVHFDQQTNHILVSMLSSTNQRRGQKSPLGIQFCQQSWVDATTRFYGRDQAMNGLLKSVTPLRAFLSNFLLEMPSSGQQYLIEICVLIFMSFKNNKNGRKF
jgi:hypothetical protein